MIKKISKFLPMVCLITGFSAFGQIETDRPDFTESPNTVPQGALQIETGFILEHDAAIVVYPFPGTATEKRTYRNTTLNTTLLRFGLFENLELRFNYAWQSSKLHQYEIIEQGQVWPSPTELPDSAYHPSRGFSTSFVGIKTNLYKTANMSIGFLGHVYIPELASGDYAKASGQKIAPEFLIPMTYQVTDRFGVAVQYGLSWDGFTANPTTSYTLALGYGITDKLSCYVEPYGFLTNNGDELHLINAGFTYLVNDNFQLDLTGGFGLNEAAPNNFVGCGASFLLFNTP